MAINPDNTWRTGKYRVSFNLFTYSSYVVPILDYLRQNKLVIVNPL